ncbi:ABC transporter substrate-binding protein [Noviherbaspirillum sp. ST9]|uniref:ABC transporter substrate-binding protein n=1 Tax=Noviherbaspirillum sp. ST9 TaxID=3401606 RepID=UPI003B5886CF
MAANWKRRITAVLALCVSTAVSAEDGVTDKLILIGQTVPLTGQVAGAVKEMNEGAKAYIESVNRAGGVHGRKIEIRTLDDGFDPAVTARNAEQLVRQDRVFAMFLNRATPHTEAILPVLIPAGVPLVAPSTGAAAFHTPVNRLLFNVRAKYQDEVAKGVEHFATVGIRDIGILHVDDSFGRDALAGFNTAMQAYKLVPAVVGRFDRAKPDTSAAVQEALKANPQAIIIVGSATTTTALIQGIRSAGSRMQVMTLSNNSSQSFVKNLGADGIGVIVSQVTPAPHLVSTPLGQEFKSVAAAHGATVSYAAMEGFVAAKVLVEGLRRAGRQLTREAFIRGLESMRKVDFGGLMVTYGPDDHTGSEFVELTMIGKDGRFLR